MTTTPGDIRVELDGERVVLSLLNHPLGDLNVSISSDKWNELVTEVIHQRSLLRIKTRKAHFITAADAARAVEK